MRAYTNRPVRGPHAGKSDGRLYREIAFMTRRKLGWKNTEIAADLGISLRLVEHIARTLIREGRIAPRAYRE